MTGPLTTPGTCTLMPNSASVPMIVSLRSSISAWLPMPEIAGGGLSSFVVGSLNVTSLGTNDVVGTGLWTGSARDAVALARDGARDGAAGARTSASASPSDSSSDSAAEGGWPPAKISSSSDSAPSSFQNALSLALRCAWRSAFSASRAARCRSRSSRFASAAAAFAARSWARASSRARRRASAGLSPSSTSSARRLTSRSRTRNVKKYSIRFIGPMIMTRQTTSSATYSTAVPGTPIHCASVKSLSR